LPRIAPYVDGLNIRRNTRSTAIAPYDPSTVATRRIILRADFRGLKPPAKFGDRYAVM